MELAEQLYAAGVPVFPCRADKAPAIPKSEDWRDHAQRPPKDAHWPSGVVGVPTPHGTVIIDLDTYKGVTREGVEEFLGCKLPWDAAMIQTTQRGGQHYAFGVDWPVRQGSNIDGVKGLDTRVSGKGYIATGQGYTPAGFGIFALAFPAALPRLPDACRHILEHIDRTPEHAVLPEGDKDIDAIRDALRHIDPGCGRSQWVKVGLALRHQFHDDEHTGYTLFDQWSGGELWSGGCPVNYEGDMYGQWSSFKAEGGVTIASLFYTAIAEGWQPPSSIDTAMAFGPGAAPADIFNALVARIHESGTDIEQTIGITEAIHGSGCNALQRDLLALALKAALKSEGLLDKKLSAKLDGLLRPEGKAPGMYGKNHTENALQFLEARYPGGMLQRSDQVWYAYNGKAWAEVPDDDMAHTIAMDMVPSAPQSSTIKGTYSVLADLAHTTGRCGADVLDSLILFDNGVLDLYTGTLLPHSPTYFTTNILPYAYNPSAVAPQWEGFLLQVFEGDQERVDLLQEWFGYMMSSSYAHHKVLLLLGPGRCGKGTIGRVLKNVVGGQNFSGGSLKAFASDAFMDSLLDIHVVFIGDAAKRVHRNHIDDVIERIKSVSGDDEVIFARKYKSTLSTTLPSRITIAANQVPNLFDDSGALASRLMVLPFEVSFLDREDIELTDKLLSEIEGIAAWSLRGLARLNARGKFIVPEISLMEAENIAQAYSPLEQFIEEACVLDSGEGILATVDLYDAYVRWAVANRESQTLLQKPFVTAFTSATRGRGCRYGKHRVPGQPSIRGYKGLQLSTEGTASAFAPAGSTKATRPH